MLLIWFPKCFCTPGDPQCLTEEAEVLCALLGKQQSGRTGQAGEGVSQADTSRGRCSQVGKGRLTSSGFWKIKGERVVLY